MGALGAVLAEHGGGDQYGAADLAGIGRLLQAGQRAGRGQIAVIGLRRFARFVPQRNRHLVIEGVEHGDQAMQQRRRETAFEGEVDALVQGGLCARALRIALGKEELPVRHALAAGMTQAQALSSSPARAVTLMPVSAKAAACGSCTSPALALARASAIGTSMS